MTGHDGDDGQEDHDESYCAETYACVPGDLPILFYDEIDASEGILEFNQLCLICR